MLGLGTRELIILAVITVLFLGPKKLPELAQGIVEAIGHLRKAFSEEARKKDGDNHDGAA
jgi:TatA/E family protein of Tat protein translocase